MKAPIRGWLYGIATNLLRNHVRQEVRGFQSPRGPGPKTARPRTTNAVAGRVDTAARLRVLAGELAGIVRRGP